MTLEPLSPLPLEILIREWEGATDKPVCSVLVTTFQHRRFIADAVGSILAQRTSFPFEVLIRDDGSTDGTANLVAGFAKDYPGIVTAILEPTRTWPRKSTIRDMQVLARGQFVAICEGDDYWTDPEKLERQVDQLRRNPSAAASFHDSVVVLHLEDGARYLGGELAPELLRDWSKEELITRTIPFRSLLYRNDRATVLPERFEGTIWTEDRFLSVRLGLRGPACFLTGVSPSVYRRHESSLSSSIRDVSIRRTRLKAQTNLAIAEYLESEGRDDAADIYLRKALGHLLELLETRDPRLRRRAALRLLMALSFPARLWLFLTTLTLLQPRSLVHRKRSRSDA